MNQPAKTLKISTELSSLQSEFDLIKTESIHALSLAINVGASDIKVSFEDLGFDEEDSKRKREAQLKSTTLVVFPQLRQYGNKLGAIKKELQDKFMISGSKRWWFVLDSRVDALWEAIQSDLIPACDIFREEILASYSDARESYRARVIEAFAGRFDLKKQDELMIKYLAKFPSPSDVASRFYVSIDGPIRISSILEDAAVAEKASILALHKVWRESIMESLQGSLRSAEAEIYELVSELTERMESKSAGSLSDTARKRFEEITNRLTLLVDFNQSLEEIASSAPLLAAQSTLAAVNEYETMSSKDLSARDSCLSHMMLKKKLNGLKQALKGEIELQMKAEGHRSLGKWMIDDED